MGPASPLKKGRRHQGERGTGSFGADSDDVAIWKLVGLLLVGTIHCEHQLRIIIERSAAQLVLDIAHNFAFRGGG